MGEYLNRIIFILSLIFLGVRIDVIGSISITEIFVFFYSPHLFYWAWKTNIPYVRKLCILFLFLMGTQILAEFMVGNDFFDAVRGIAVTFFALLLFLFFLQKLCNDFSLIKYIPLALLINILLFGDQFNFSEANESAYFKFYMAPIISYVVCLLSLSRNRLIEKYILLIFVFASLMMIIGGARSLGFSLLFSALLFYIYNKYKTFNLKRILPGLLTVIVVFQLFYALLYVPKVASGEWGSEQNRGQLVRINNSNNVLMMLFSARADFYVSFLAFSDKPLWGHGAWAKDVNLKYAKIQEKLFKEDSRSAKRRRNGNEPRWVPAHSVVMGMGARNGIFAFLLFLVIFIIIYSIGFKALFPHSHFNAFLIYTLVESSQHLLFGPMAILKNYGSIAFAIFLSLYCLKKMYYFRIRHDKVQTISSNSNIQAKKYRVV